MRIALATICRTVLGGAEAYVRALLPELSRRGHDVALLYESDRNDSNRDILDSLADIPHWDHSQLGTDGVVAALRNWKPSIVYNQGIVDHGFEQALVDEFPSVMYAHGYYGTCISGQKCWGLSGRTCQRRFSAACLACYYPLHCGGWSPFYMWRGFCRQKQRFGLLQSYKRVVVASRHMQDEYRRHNLPEARIALVSPTTAKKFDTHPHQRTGNDTLLFAGRITREKGLAILLDAMQIAQRRLARQITLNVAGDGTELSRTQRKAKKLQLNTSFLGWLGTAQMEQAMRDANLLVVPSIWPEPFGLVGVEAAGRSLPAVAFDVGGISDWLIDGKTGLLAKYPPSADGLADVIVRALEDPNGLQKLGEGAWYNAARFSLDAHLDKLLDVLESAAHSGC